MNLFIHALSEAAQHPKVGAAVASGTSGAGLASLLGWIPEDIDKLYSLVGVLGLLAGAIYTLTMSVVAVRRFQLEKRKYEEGRDRVDDKATGD